MSIGQGVNTQKMSYSEYGFIYANYLRVLRVVYTKPRTDFVEDFTIRKLTCKIISPLQKTRGIGIPKFETLQETKKRLEEWVKATGMLLEKFT